jgi:Ca2+-binding RTX toxin-like protein
MQATALNFTTGDALNVVMGTGRGDRLFGTAGADRIEGLSGNDILNGGLGSDTLIGGAGKDIFVFNASLGPTNIDVLEGFRVVDDTIQIENAIFSGLTRTGTLRSNHFRANDGGVPVDSDDFILFDRLTGNAFYDPDGVGPTSPVHFVTLTGVVGIVSQSDFVVI